MSNHGERLNKILFFIEEKNQLESVEKLRKNMGETGKIIEVHLTDYIEEVEKLNWEVKTGMVAVTDSEQILGRLVKAGIFTIAMLHEKNQEKDLSAAPYAISCIEELEYTSFEQAYLRMAGLPWKITETERCIIRETIVEDVDAFYQIYADPSITRYMDKLYENPEDEREYTRQYIDKIYGFYGYGMWTVLNRENGQVIGRAGITWRAGFDIPELGFMIGKAFQRQGYAYEVCRAILDYSKKELGFTQMQTLVRAGNKASLQLCRKLGFIRQGTVEIQDGEYEQYIMMLGSKGHLFSCLHENR